MTEGNSKEFEMAVGTSNVLDSTGMMEGANYYSPLETNESESPVHSNWSGGAKADMGQLCRSCANSSDYLIPIYEGEGLEHQLEFKIQKHLPIQVALSDTLPLQLCYQCASTLIAWDSMITSCIEADKKLRAMQEAAVQESKTSEMYEDSQSHVEEEDNNMVDDSDDEPLIKTKAASEKTRASPIKKKILSKAKSKAAPVKNKTATNSKDDEVDEEERQRSELLAILGETKQEKDESEDENDHENQALDSAELRDLNETSGDKLFRCNVCLNTYDNITTYEAHLKTHNNVEPQMVCHICGSTFKSLRKLKAHVTTHGKNSSIYPCKQCGHVFSTLAARKRHKLTHLHATDWRCELCNRKFTQHSFYIDHMLMHDLKKQMKIFICSYCGGNFDDELSLLEHEKSHSAEDVEMTLKDEREDEEEESEERQEQIEIVDNIKIEPSDEPQMIVLPMDDEDGCNGVQTEGIQIVDDMNVLDGDFTIIEVTKGDEDKYTCGECGKECEGMDAVNEHMREHSQEDYFECLHCKRVFKFKASLVQHVRKFHALSRPYSCEICNATFGNKNGLRNHRTIHLSLKYPCEECGNEFKGRSGLYLHKQRVHRGKKDYMCDYCGKLFSLKCQRDTHRRIHTGEKPYRCEVCGAGFRAQSGLYAHRKTHTNERPYKCEVCGKCLRLPYNLRLHMRTHTGEKPYECDICGRGFSQPGDCKKHRKTHNKQRPYFGEDDDEIEAIPQSETEPESVPVHVTVSDPIKINEKADFVDVTYLAFDEA